MNVKKENALDAGVTMLELMFAISIMVIVVVSLFGSLIGFAQVGDLSETRMNAAAPTASVLEELRNMPPDRILSYVPPKPKKLDKDATFTINYIQADGTPLALPIADPSVALASLPNPLEVRVTLSYRDKRGHPLSTTVSSFFAR